MRHFEQSEWMRFYAGQLEREQVQEMEEHLLQCEECSSIFLACISTGDLDRAAALIPEDFRTRTLNYIAKSEAPKDRRVSRRRKRRRLFSYYVAAAAVTLILMSGGFFQSAVLQAGRLSISPVEPARSGSHWLSWPESLEKSTMDWVKKLDKVNFKEVGR